ncbi:Pertactin precursor [Shigella dysenteriae 1617]|uniref:Pertactin n=1 Tax=Shigella dysenteriae 1617 TaxID=754093 RepID=A0A0A6ZWS9_SHIDY|nr:Pertactin precursor [Shigella dysenteriae 1617]
MGYSHSHIGFDRGGHGSVDSYSLGGYASWEHESGFYLDGVVKLNRFESNVAGKMSSGGAANGSYHSNGLGGHIETGMRFTDGNWNLTPYASLTGFTADNPEYHLSNGSWRTWQCGQLFSGRLMPVGNMKGFYLTVS